jgi:hypothetical protein
MDLFVGCVNLVHILKEGHPEQSVYNRHWYQHLNNASLEPILRYSIHVTAEPLLGRECRDPTCYEKTVNEVIKQGLCRALGSSIFHFCANYSDVAYVNKVTFLYAHEEIQAANEFARSIALGNYLKRLYNATTIALGRSMDFQPRL